MDIWHAKVHKSGSKVAIFNGGKLMKVVNASEDTFQPAEAQKFAEELITELKSRTSSQMETPASQPAVTTDSELQSASMAVSTSQAQGKGAGETPAAPVAAAVPQPEKTVEVATAAETENVEGKVASENSKLRSIIASLKNKLSSERSERILERKARRGLAIAKQLVVEGSLENSYDAIKGKIAQIVKLEDCEIDRLERKTAGECEFDSIESAQKELRRQDRVARINRTAAAEAQEDDDIDEAEKLDQKADEAEAKVAHIASVIEEMKKTASEECSTEGEPKDDEGPAKEEPKAASEEPAKEDSECKTAAEESKTAEEPAKEEPKAAAEEPAKEEPKAASAGNTTLAELARSYRIIASNHRKLAEKAEADGDIELADKQDALGDAAEEQAEEIEKKFAAEEPAKEEPVAAEEPAKEEPKAASESSTAETPEMKAKKEAARKEPGKTVTSSEHNPLTREGEAVEDNSFGIDKNASLVEQNDYSNDPDVEALSQMWRSVEREERN